MVANDADGSRPSLTLTDDEMRELGYRVETHTYPMPHSVCPEELRDIDDWLTRAGSRRLVASR